MLIKVAEYGEMPHDVPLQLVTTYPQGAGFPFFTWAHMFFTNANQVIGYRLIIDWFLVKTVVGFYKGNGDFGKPSMYNLQDISKLMKPLPYVTLSKGFLSIFL